MTEATNDNLLKPKRRHRPRDGHMGQFVTDKELADYFGIPWDDFRVILQRLDDSLRSGFPKKDPFFGDRRPIKAVDQWLDTYLERKMGGSQRRTAHG